MDYYCFVKLDITPYEIIFNKYKEEFELMVNTIILIAKNFIYTKRCLQEPLLFSALIVNISNYKNIEERIVKTNISVKSSKKHKNKWLMYDKV